MLDHFKCFVYAMSLNGSFVCCISIVILLRYESQMLRMMLEGSLIANGEAWETYAVLNDCMTE